MKSVKKFFINGAILALSTVILRWMSVSFNAFITKALGTEAIGLFTLVMSVYTLAVTFASSAVNLSSVRLIGDALARLEKENADKKTIKKTLKSELFGCIKYSLFFSLLTMTVILILAPLIGIYILGDERTVLSLKVLSLSLPPIAVASAVSGYFTGVRKAYKNAVISTVEQFAKIIVITALLVTIAPRGIEYACVAVVGGGAIGEAVSLITSVALYLFDKVKADGKNTRPTVLKESESALSRAAKISFPVALGSYVRQGLVAAEHISIPKALESYGLSKSNALSSYGILHGMVFPIIFFPSSVLSAFASLLVPEISSSLAIGNRARAKSIAERVIKTCLIFAFAASGIFTAFASEFGIAVYNSNEAGKYIALIAPLIPIMYLDTSVDFILKGLGEQIYTMLVNILDALLSLSLVLILVPRLGLSGYIMTLYIVEIVNCALSLWRLIYKLKLEVKLSYIIRPLISVYLGTGISKALFYVLLPYNISNSILLIISIAIVYLSMRLIGAVTRADMNYLLGNFKKAKFEKQNS